MEIGSFRRKFPPFPVDVLEDVKKVEFQICFGAQNLDKEQMSVILGQKFPKRLLKNEFTYSMRYSSR